LMVPEVRCCVHGGLEREPLAPVKVSALLTVAASTLATAATGTTVITDVPLFPVDASLLRSTVAVMIAVPGASATTIPSGETVAFAESDVVQTKLRSRS